MGKLFKFIDVGNYCIIFEIEEGVLIFLDVGIECYNVVGVRGMVIVFDSFNYNGLIYFDIVVFFFVLGIEEVVLGI